MGLNFFNKLNKAKLPDVKDLVSIPKKLKYESENIEINKIVVRFFNQDFSKCIESIGIINHDTAIPLIYFDRPFKGAVIMFDDTSYINTSKNNELCIDVCESYPFTLDHNSELYQDLKIQYYNDTGNEKIDSKQSQELFNKTGLGYFIPVFLNKIPIPIIKIEKEKRLSIVDETFVKHRIDITQHLIRQLSNVKLLERVSNKDNTGLIYCAILFLIIGGFLGSLLMAWTLS